MCERATPDQWTKFITASRVIKIFRNNEPKFLKDLLTENYFEERRRPGVGLFFDNSLKKIGRQSLPNRLIFMRTIKYPWNDANEMTNDQIHVDMKSSFFPYYRDKN